MDLNPDVISEPIERTSLLLADDEMLVRAGLRMILDGANGIEVVGEAGDGLAAVQAVESLRPDVVLLDIRMPGMDGIEAARRITQREGHPVVVMLTAFDTEGFVADALAAGAQGFLLKSSPPREIIDAVVAARQGEMPFTPAVMRRVAALAARSSQPPGEAALLDDLSERELQVALGVADAHSNAEIAESLHLSLATVKTYLNRIFDKTGTDGRVQLALLVERTRISGHLPGRLPD